jgi:glycoside/pentoside/hexuronide:cation symporter, GPH family
MGSVLCKPSWALARMLPMNREPTIRHLAAYALPALPLAALTLPFYVMVPEFYARDLGLPLAAVGYVLLLVRLVDAISDPVAGWLADRTKSRFGRRRIWVALATPFVALAAFALFSPPKGAGLLYLGLWATLLSLAWTAIQVPYGAWGAELSRTYEGRTRVAAFRESGTVIGTLAALLLPAIVQIRGGTAADGLWALGLAVAILLPLCVATCVTNTPEPVQRLAVKAAGTRGGFAALRQNKPFMRLLIAFFVNSLANGLPATLFLFFVADSLGARDSAGPLLVLYFLCGVIGVPLWLKLANQTSKHFAWAMGMLLACASFAIAPFLHQGDVAWFGLVCVLTGFALGADVVLPASMQADVIDIDTAATGEERAGLYLGLWALVTKLAFAGAVGIAFPLLAMAGYDPGRGIVTSAGLTTLGLLYAAAPIALKIVAIALVYRFPMTRAEVNAAANTINARATI